MTKTTTCKCDAASAAIELPVLPVYPVPAAIVLPVTPAPNSATCPVVVIYQCCPTNISGSYLG